MSNKISPVAAVGRKLGHELREFALIFAYLYVCFGAIMLYKTAILRGQGIDYTPYGFAVVKALLLAKFILMGHMARVGDRYERRRFIFVVAHKSLLFLVLLLGLTVIEEAIVGVVHGRTIGASLADVAGGTLPQIVASCVIMLLILIPYLIFRELNEVLGEGRLRQILLDYRIGSNPAVATRTRRVSRSCPRTAAHAWAPRVVGEGVLFSSESRTRGVKTGPSPNHGGTEKRKGQQRICPPCNNRPAPRLYRRPPSVIRTNERLLVDIAYLTTAVPLPANSGHLTVLEPAFEIGVSEPLGGTANE